MLKQLTVMDWPNMKSQTRSSVHRKLHRQAYPVKESISLDEFIKNSRGGLGG